MQYTIIIQYDNYKPYWLNVVFVFQLMLRFSTHYTMEEQLARHMYKLRRYPD